MVRSSRGKDAAVVCFCLQAQRVTGLPDAMEGHQIELACHQYSSLHEYDDEPVACARATSAAGVAAFHGQLLLLQCPRGPAVADSVTVIVTVCSSTAASHSTRQIQAQAWTLLGTACIDLAQQQQLPSPTALRFVLAAGAVLTLALHHKRVHAPRGRSSIHPPSCCCFRCLMWPLLHHQHVLSMKHHHQQHQDSDGDEEEFITIDKGTISRRPPSDNLITTDDENDQDGKPKHSSMCLLDADSSRVEDEFLAMLASDSDSDCDIDLDMLIKEAEADFACQRASICKEFLS